MGTSDEPFLRCLAEAKTVLEESLKVTNCEWCVKQVQRVLKILDLITESSQLASKVLEVHREIATISAEVRRDAQKLKSP